MRSAIILSVLGVLTLGCGDDDVGDAAIDAVVDMQSTDAIVDATMDATPDDAMREDAMPDDAMPDAAGDTWTTFGQGFMSTYCVECHSGGARDYQSIADVMRDAQKVRCGVASTTLNDCTANDPVATQFPVGNGPKPDAEMRDRFVAWIDSGLME